MDALRRKEAEGSLERLLGQRPLLGRREVTVGGGDLGRPLDVLLRNPDEPCGLVELHAVLARAHVIGAGAHGQE